MCRTRDNIQGLHKPVSGQLQAVLGILVVVVVLIFAKSHGGML